MWYRIRSFFSSATKARIDYLENKIKCFEKEYEETKYEISQEFAALRKLTTIKDHAVIKYPSRSLSYITLFGDGNKNIIDEDFENKRKELKDRNYEFSFRYQSGDEIWTKREQI